MTVSAPAPTAVLDRGRIQPCGFLLGLSEEWVVTHASANVGEFLDIEATELLGGPADDHLGVEAIHSLRNRLALLRHPDATERMSRCALLGDQRHFDLAIHRAGPTITLEGQPSNGKEFGDVTGTVLGMMSRLAPDSDLTLLLDTGAEQLRALTGFDRVAMIRLDQKGAGQVVAECNRASADSMLGERSLLSGDTLQRYLQRPLHVIADTSAPAVELLGGRPDQQLDLSRAMLAAGSPERLAELRACDASAAMLLSLIIDGRLWGVIDCQHHFARAPGFERASIAQLFAYMFALRVELCELRAGAPT